MILQLGFAVHERLFPQFVSSELPEDMPDLGWDQFFELNTPAALKRTDEASYRETSERRSQWENDGGVKRMGQLIMDQPELAVGAANVQDDELRRERRETLERVLPLLARGVEPTK